MIHPPSHPSKRNDSWPSQRSSKTQSNTATMADEASSSTAPQGDLSVNISIVSPSMSVNAPLYFPSLPPSTTLAQIKQRVRDALDSKPSNEQQRLIHQGKLLSREDQTLLDVFGEQKVINSLAWQSCRQRILLAGCDPSYRRVKTDRLLVLAPRLGQPYCAPGNSRSSLCRSPHALEPEPNFSSSWPEPCAKSHSRSSESFCPQPSSLTS